MSDRLRTTPEQLRELLDNLDRACRESEAARHQAEHRMNRRPCWPERRSGTRWCLPVGKSQDHDDGGNQSA